MRRREGARRRDGERCAAAYWSQTRPLSKRAQALSARCPRGPASTRVLELAETRRVTLLILALVPPPFLCVSSIPISPRKLWQQHLCTPARASTSQMKSGTFLPFEASDIH